MLALAIGHQLKKLPAEIGAMTPEDFAACVAFYMNAKRQEAMKFGMPALPRAARDASAEDAALERRARIRGRVQKKLAEEAQRKKESGREKRKR